MIVNKPTPEDFEKQEIQYLHQSINLIYDKDQYQQEWLDKETLESIELNEIEYWKFHQGILNNSLTLLFPSLENYLKKKICYISPLLLLADEPRKWRSKHKDINFSDLYIHQFDDLLILYTELNLGNIASNTSQILDELRNKRNKITHGILEENITPKYIFETLYTISINIWGEKEWWRKFKSHELNEPLFGIYDHDIERSLVTRYIYFFISHIGKKKTGEMIGVNFKQRNYYCPYCQNWANHDVDTYDCNFSILVPNKPKSENLYCPVCGENYKVIRKPCIDEECPGNVISEDGMYCLTFYCEQE